MYVPGHLAMGYLAAAGPALAKRRPVDLYYALAPALLGSVTPDLIDKPMVALDIIDHSRALGHSIFFVALLLVIWFFLDRRNHSIARPFGWWIAGIGSHHFADLANDAFRGLETRGYFFTTWFGWPLLTSDYFQLQIELGRDIRFHTRWSILEIGVFALTLAVIVASSRYVRD